MTQCWRSCMTGHQLLAVAASAPAGCSRQHLLHAGKCVKRAAGCCWLLLAAAGCPAWLTSTGSSSLFCRGASAGGTLRSPAAVATTSWSPAKPLTTPLTQAASGSATHTAVPSWCTESWAPMLSYCATTWCCCRCPCAFNVRTSRRSITSYSSFVAQWLCEPVISRVTPSSCKQLRHASEATADV
jgi:hypothetical protein